MLSVVVPANGSLPNIVLTPASIHRIRDVLHDERFDVLHVVQPRKEYDGKRQDAEGKPWASCWLELGGGGAASHRSAGASGTGPAGLLRESGYDEQPFAAPRWNEGEIGGFIIGCVTEPVFARCTTDRPA